MVSFETVVVVVELSCFFWGRPLGFRVWVQGSGFRVPGSGSRVQGSGGSGFRV